jgi:SAM-dependent methyltransferase
VLSTFFTRLGDSNQQFWAARAREASEAPVRTATLSPVCEEEAMILDEVEAQQLMPWLRLHPGLRALELGCGPGRWVRRMAREGAAVVGVEREPLFLQEAQRALEQDGLASGVKLLQHDLREGVPDEAQGPFDVAILSLLLLYLDDDAAQRVASFLQRNIRPGGRLIVTESARATRSEEEYTIEGLPYAALYRSPDELAELFTSRGFRLLYYDDVRGFPTIDLMEKMAQRLGFGSRTNVNRMLSPTGAWWRSIVTCLSPAVVRLWPRLDKGSRGVHRLLGDHDYRSTQQLWVFER